MKITVFTPTYNRSKKILRVYESLKNQSNKNFEWLIVDDGSSDDTEEVVENLIIKEKSFSIRYYNKQNGGKHTAHNIAVSESSNELFFCVDSDDYIVDNAIETIIKYSQYLTDENTGILALKKEIDGKVLSDKLPTGIRQCEKLKLEQIYCCKGEFTLIYKTSILKKHLFPEIKNERFVAESVLYDKLDQYGSLLLVNEVITVCEYLDDGYTSNYKKLMLNNPIGFKLYYKQRIDLAISLKECVNYIIRYNAFCILSNSNDFNYKGKKTILVYLLKPIGFLAYLYYKLKS